MAATLTNQLLVQNGVPLVESATYSTLVEGATITHSHLGPDGVAPARVWMEVIVQPTSKDPVLFSFIEGSNDLTNDTIAIVFDTVAGGDLAGAVCKVFIEWVAQATGGIS